MAGGSLPTNGPQTGGALPDGDQTSPVLRHPARLALYNLVRSNWGIWETELGRLSSLGRNNVKYHLVRLVRARLVQARSEGRKVHYFPRDVQAANLQKAIVNAQDATRRDILCLIRDHPELSWRAISRVLEITPRAVRWHINQLATAGLISVEREGMYCRAQLSPLVEAVLSGDIAALAQNVPDINITAARRSEAPASSDPPLTL